MGMPKEANDFLVDSAPSLLGACREALEVLRHIGAGLQPRMPLEDCCKTLEWVIAEAEGPYRDRE